MFIGHWAPAIAAAAASRKSPKLGVLFIAAQFVDWLFFLFAIVGVERMGIRTHPEGFNRWDLYHYPYSHSLLGNFAFAVLFAAIIWGVTKNRAAALIAGAVVLSHWFMDVISHAPDMTLAGGEPRLGLGMQDTIWLATAFELSITFGALAWYANRTNGKSLPIVLLAVVLAVFQTINWFGEQASEVTLQLHLTALFAFAIVTAIAWWVGQTRSYRASRD